MELLFFHKYIRTHTIKKDFALQVQILLLLLSSNYCFQKTYKLC